MVFNIIYKQPSFTAFEYAPILVDNPAKVYLLTLANIGTLTD